MDINGEKFNPAYTGYRRDIEDLVPRSAHKILEFGCSIGELGDNLKRHIGANVTGVELDEKMAQVAQKRLDRVIVADIDNLTFDDHFSEDNFDCIIFADVLEHLKNPWDVLKDATNHLDREGYIIISIPNIRHYSVIVNLLFRGYWPYRSRGIHDKTHLRFFTLKNIIELVQYADLDIVTLKRNYRIIEKPHPYNHYARCLSFPPFRELFVFQYLIVAKKRQ